MRFAQVRNVLMLAVIFACIVSVGAMLGLTFRLERARPGAAAASVLAAHSWALWACAGTVLVLGVMMQLQRRWPLPAMPGTPRLNAVFLSAAAVAVAAILWLV